MRRVCLWSSLCHLLYQRNQHLQCCLWLGHLAVNLGLAIMQAMVLSLKLVLHCQCAPVHASHDMREH